MPLVRKRGGRPQGTPDADAWLDEVDRLLAGHRTLSALLAAACRAAIVLMPGAAFAGIALRTGELGDPDLDLGLGTHADMGTGCTHAASHADLADLDRHQYRAGDEPGPARRAVSTGKPFVVAAHRPPVRLGRFAGRAAAHGFRTAIAVPLRHDGTVVGALTLYSTRDGAFPRRTVVRAQALADRLANQLVGGPTASSSSSLGTG